MTDQSEKSQENSGEIKLWVKLKLPKIENPDPIEAKSDDQLRICEICNKGFSSGKALGGHMRVHVQENKGDLSKIRKYPVKIDRNSVEKSQHLVSLSEKPNCPLCGKGFPSLKSLFGHMRCHPEREYRGICPPRTGPNHLSSSSSVTDERETTPPAVPTWLAKAKRGRGSLIPAAMSSSSAMSEEDREAVYDLMSLAQGESFIPDLIIPSKRKIENSDSFYIGAENGKKDGIFESKKQIIGDLGYGYKRNELRINETVPYEQAKEKAKVLFGSSENYSSEDEFGENDSDGSISSDELITNMRSSKSKKTIIKKNPKFRDLKAVEKKERNDDNNNNIVEKGPIVKYKCSTCNKCFPSHQALGGHRSSHNKSRYSDQDSELLFVTKNNDSSPPVSRGDEAKEPNDNNENIKIISAPSHQCKICNKVFPTGQALGGHKRCHWTGPTEGQVSAHATSSVGEEVGPVSAQATSSLGEEASGAGVRGFDLNEPAQMEEEESENGHISYSYNSAA